MVVAVCRLLRVIGGKKRKSGSPNCILNYSHCSIPCLKKYLAHSRTKVFSGVGEQLGAEGKDAHILTSLYSGCYVCKCRFEWLAQLFSLCMLTVINLEN